MDFEMFSRYMDDFSRTDAHCKTHNCMISETQKKSIFLLLDIDNSDELEMEEITQVITDRQLIG